MAPRLADPGDRQILVKYLKSTIVSTPADFALHRWAASFDCTHFQENPFLGEVRAYLWVRTFTDISPFLTILFRLYMGVYLTNCIGVHFGNEKFWLNATISVLTAGI